MLDSQIAALEQRRAHLLGQIAATGEMRAGSLTARYRRCGTAGCHCAQPGDPRHGPVLSLTRQQGGKTITRIIPSHTEAETRARIAEHRRFRQLSKALVEVSTALCEAGLATGSAAKKPQTAVLAESLAAEAACEIERLLGADAAQTLGDFEAAETAVRTAVLAVAARFVAERLNADHSDQHAAGLPCGCGHTARYAGRRAKTIRTALGAMTLERASYHCASTIFETDSGGGRRRHAGRRGRQRRLVDAQGPVTRTESGSAGSFKESSEASPQTNEHVNRA